VRIGVLLSFGILSIAHGAESWRPILKDSNPGRNFRGPADKFVIPVPDSLDTEYLKHIALELDDVDVTSFVKRVGSNAVYSPVENLGFGIHHMRVVYYAPDGNIEELAAWRIEVRQSSLYRQAVVEGNVQLNFNHRVKENNIPIFSKENYVDGSANLQAAVAGENWKLNSTLSLIGNGNYSALGMKRGVDISQFRMQAETPNILADIGALSIGVNNLAIGIVNNRGASLTVKDDSHRYTATAIAVSPIPLNGAEGGLGVSDPENRINAIALSAFPLKVKPERMYLQLTYVQGSNASGMIGAGMAGDRTATQGNAWSVVSDSSLVEQQFRMRLEYAAADTSRSASDVLIPIQPLQDSAYSVLAEYQPRQDSSAATLTAWKLSLLKQHVGRDYSSVGNLTLPRDKDLLQLAAEWARGGLYSRASVSSEFDNVNHDPEIARIGTDRVNLTLSYAPELKYSKDGRPQYGLLGQQNYSLAANKTWSNNSSKPAAAFYVPTENETTSVNVNAAFNYEKGFWSVGYGISNFVDNTGLQQDYDAVSGIFSANFVLWKINISPSLQIQTNQSAGAESKIRSGNIDLILPIAGDRLFLGAGYSRTENTVSDGSVDSVSSTAKASLEWRIRNPSKNKPGYSLRLSGSTCNAEDFVSGLKSDSYQVYLTGTINAPFGL